MLDKQKKKQIIYSSLEYQEWDILKWRSPETIAINSEQ